MYKYPELNENDVHEMWRREVLPRIQAVYEDHGRKDWPARRESFCDFVDSLVMDGVLDEEFSYTIDHPIENK